MQYDIHTHWYFRLILGVKVLLYIIILYNVVICYFRFSDAIQVIVRYPGFKLSSFEQLLAVAKSHYQLCQGVLPRG